MRLGSRGFRRSPHGPRRTLGPACPPRPPRPHTCGFPPSSPAALTFGAPRDPAMLRRHQRHRSSDPEKVRNLSSPSTFALVLPVGRALFQPAGVSRGLPAFDFNDRVFHVSDERIVFLSLSVPPQCLAPCPCSTFPVIHVIYNPYPANSNSESP